MNDRPGEPSEPVVDGPKFTESVEVIEAAPAEALVGAAAELQQIAAAMPDAGLSIDDPRHEWYCGPLLVARQKVNAALAPFTEDTDHDA